ncbi:hypothetical protein [Pseudogracilibacillus auburnensis]|uniref:hypothetical protein n=1 Tax=Pseudogracilibacillus auburnensis TaxID=1494959 RepID=UPI001A960C74|nr:hypothetical protein [Pseudogracilibacillus auburnensis]MBO1004537.1 hypothetical protein [Pseudogracilibacillus auburnensis]
MALLILQLVFICGVIYGLIIFFIEVKKRSNMSKYQLGVSIALIVAGTAAFLMTID